MEEKRETDGRGFGGQSFLDPLNPTLRLGLSKQGTCSKIRDRKKPFSSRVYEAPVAAAMYGADINIQGSKINKSQYGYGNRKKREAG